jgi:hypothetical protein
MCHGLAQGDKMNNKGQYKITKEQMFKAYEMHEQGVTLTAYAESLGVKLSYLQSLINKQSVKDEYLMQPTTLLSACGGLSIEARR